MGISRSSYQWLGHVPVNQALRCAHFSLRVDRLSEQLLQIPHADLEPVVSYTDSSTGDVQPILVREVIIEDGVCYAEAIVRC